jgi:hypothetical protein
MIISDKHSSILKHNWRDLKSKHITYLVSCIDGKQVLAHRLIAELEGWDLDGKVIDHINGDGKDNRVENLQVVTQSQNMMKQRKPANCTSNFKGVNAFRGKWRTRITKEGETKSYGVYASEAEAALAYNYVAKHHFGDFAVINEVHA